MDAPPKGLPQAERDARLKLLHDKLPGLRIHSLLELADALMACCQMQDTNRIKWIPSLISKQAESVTQRLKPILGCGLARNFQANAS
eukprot:5590946-Amphidinium_carterae.1